MKAQDTTSNNLPIFDVLSLSSSCHTRDWLRSCHPPLAICSTPNTDLSPRHIITSISPKTFMFLCIGQSLPNLLLAPNVCELPWGADSLSAETEGYNPRRSASTICKGVAVPGSYRTGCFAQAFPPAQKSQIFLSFPSNLQRFSQCCCAVSCVFVSWLA